jgi:hypothetical protein
MIDEESDLTGPSTGAGIGIGVGTGVGAGTGTGIGAVLFFRAIKAIVKRGGRIIAIIFHVFLTQLVFRKIIKTAIMMTATPMEIH